MKELLEGLQILIKYDPDGEVCAEHDVISLGGPDPSELPPEEAARLEALHFHFLKKEDTWQKFT